MMRGHLSQSDRGRKALLICIGTAVLIILIFATGFLKKQQTWANLNYGDVYLPNYGLIERSDIEEYGIVSAGPYYDLPAGTYHLNLFVQTDGKASVTLSCSNGSTIVYDPPLITAAEDTYDLDFTLKQAADNFQIIISFDEGTYLNVLDIRLYTPFYNDNKFTASFLLLAVCFLYCFNLFRPLDVTAKRTLWFLGIAVVVCSAPVMKDSIVKTIDLEFHAARIENLADGLRSGQFPVRAGGFSFNGYGAITSIFYPDLLLVPFALLRNLGASLTYVLACFTIACNILSAITSYHCARRIWNSRDAGMCTAILYVACAYRLNNLFIRGALGEALAMSFLPLFIEGIWEICFGNPNRWRVLTAGAFLIFMSHILSTIMAALVACFVGVFCLPRLIRDRRLLSLIKAAAATLGLSLFFIVPMVMTMREGINADVINVYRLQDKAISPAQLFLQSRGLILSTLADPTIDTGAVELGLMLVVGIALIGYHLSTDSTPRRVPEGKVCLLFTAGGLFFAFMATTMFPWTYVSIITTFFNRIQFAWRFIGPASVLLCLCSGWAYSRTFRDRSHTGALILLALSLLIVLPTISEQTRRGDFFRFGESTSGNILYEEYQIPGTDLNDTVDQSVHATGDVQIENVEKNGTKLIADITSGSGTADFPLFAFTGYQATVSGSKKEIVRGDNNRIQISLKPGETGRLEIQYETPRLWKVMDCVSLAILLILVFSRYSRKKSKIMGA